jgi:8-oxo-dGTP pyrophosphatase MutT (NUDIX family)
LGESTLEGAIREVEEECSLRLDRKWIEDLVPLKYGGCAPREKSGGFAHVFETSGDAFIVIIPSA